MNAQAQPNVIDRLVGYFAPHRAAPRMRARVFMTIAGSFVGANGNPCNFSPPDTS